MQRNLETILKNTINHNGCLEWIKCLNTDGYPRANIGGNVNIKVHRVVWELHNNQDATGLIIRHKCDNPKCINPEHLESGTVADNIKDRDVRLRHGFSKLTPNKVRVIRSLRGIVPQKYIAEMFNIDPRTVSSVQLKRHWKWIT